MSEMLLRSHAVSDENDKELVAKATRNALSRLVRCLFAERLLNPDTLLWSSEQRQAWLPLWSSRTVLYFADLRRRPANTLLNRGTIHVLNERGQRRLVEKPDELIDAVASDWCVVPATEGMERLSADIENSILNDALARRHRAAWSARISEDIRASGDKRFTTFLTRTMPSHQAAMLLDQWGSLEGHPFYPTWKSKPGLALESLEQCSPEFGARVNLRIASIRRNWTYVEKMAHVDDYNSWFSRNYPDLWADWSKRVTDRGHNPAEWLPLPIHPWHLKHYVEREFASEIANGLLEIEGPEILTIPSMSFRTMLPDTPDAKPFIKLPIALWMTSEQRTLQAKSIHMGPRLSTLISQIVAADETLQNTLELFHEELGAILHDAETGDEHAGRFLSVVYRDANAIARTDGMLPVTVAALLSGSPIDGRPLLCEFVDQIASDKAGATDFLRTYVDVILRPVLSIYLQYGIALEAHQQNSTVLFDPTGRPRKLVIRDFGDGRSFAPLFEERGYTLKPFSRVGILPTTFSSDISLVRSFVIDACFVCHLHEIALCLEEHYALTEAWSIIRDGAESVFDTLKPRVHSHEFWQEEREAFLERPWPTRSVLTMHLQRYRDYRLEHHLPNPLARTT